MAFWEIDKDWDAFFLEQGKKGTQKLLNLCNEHRPTLEQNIETLKENIEEAKDHLNSLKDSLEDEKANLIVIDKMKDSALWRLDQIENEF